MFYKHFTHKLKQTAIFSPYLSSECEQSLPLFSYNRKRYLHLQTTFLFQDSMVTYQTEEELKTIFVSSCIESAARSIGCTASEMYLRMKRVNLIENYIWEFYDVLHTESRETVTEDILKTLKIWEEKAGIIY